MRRLLRGCALVGAATAALVLPTAVPASADGHLTLVADGFLLPAHIEAAGSTLRVADGFTGTLTQIDLGSGARGALAEGLGFATSVTAPGGPVYATHSSDDGSEVGVVQVTGPRTRLVADTMAAELAINPDGQPQFDDNQDPFDALSNPYDLTTYRGTTYVADAGGNTIYTVRGSRLAVLTVLPVLTGDDNEACGEDSVNNGVEGGGCDPVPTGIDVGPDGYLYVSGLGAEVEGSVYKIDPRTGEIVDRWSDLPPLTDVTVAPDGTVYAASLFGFAVFAIAPDGTVTSSPVPFPTSVSFSDGVLYVANAVFGEGEEDPPVGSVWTLALDSFS